MQPRSQSPLARLADGAVRRRAVQCKSCQWLLALVLLLAACSRSGSLYGDLVVPSPRGHGTAAARVDIKGVPVTDAFVRDWAAATAAFQTEVAPVRKVEAAAASALEKARWAWDQALAAPRNRQKYARIRAREQVLRAAERRLVEARRQVEEVARRHGGEAVALLDRHAALHVQTDGAGHYVLAGLPTGPAYVYVQVAAGRQRWVWFRSVQVRPGAQQVDLTEANSGGWPFDLRPSGAGEAEEAGKVIRERRHG
jgi:hypothetical protein